ncbi:MAG: glycosyl hydrolase family 88 [Lachnospiraceae bacterium]|nr:glycosyl hydrolase family 88 [Lachnospiraceae bacterium]
MSGNLSKDEVKWLEDIYEKVKKKVSAESDRIGEAIPYIAINGKYPEDHGTREIEWWTNGFWAGLLWQMYHATGDEKYKVQARITEERLDRTFDEFEGLYHDVGFMWMHSAVADYRLTGDKKSFSRGHHAANLLAGRFNILGNYIRAWNGDMAGWMIIDCLMNLSILYWASEETKDPRFAAIAKRHADTALEKIFRKDGSSNHITIMNPENGDVLDTPAGQGCKKGSSWSRGQSWALYGFIISYAHTKEERYLDAAKQAAHYFIANLALNDYLPLCDFRAPKEPVLYDSTAGACAACGLLEIAKHVPEEEKPLYERSALKILMAMDKAFCNWNVEEDGILYYGRTDYNSPAKDEEISIIYGDYFFTEAVLRLLNKDFFIW